MMDIIDKTNAIQFIRPNAIFTLRGENIEWLDLEQKEPNTKEIENALIAYKAHKEVKENEEMQKRTEILERLGISEEEAKLLLK